METVIASIDDLELPEGFDAFASAWAYVFLWGVKGMDFV